MLADHDPMLDGLHVLLVEDAPDARELVRRILEERGARVTAVDNAADAIVAFLGDKPDVIVSDIGLPGEDGYALIRRLRALEGHGGVSTPAAALTALVRSDDRTRALLAGFQTHIGKPVNPLELVVVVASLTGRTGQLSH
jgi:CheY-like chemotaxis protein